MHCHVLIEVTSNLEVQAKVNQAAVNAYVKKLLFPAELQHVGSH
jgi:hypothetical protein